MTKWNKKFQLYYLKVSANVKIAMQCFENFGGANAPNAPWLRACGDVITPHITLDS